MFRYPLSSFSAISDTVQQFLFFYRRQPVMYILG